MGISIVTYQQHYFVLGNCSVLRQVTPATMLCVYILSEFCCVMHLKLMSLVSSLGWLTVYNPLLENAINAKVMCI